MNLLKKYPELLELAYLTEAERNHSLRSIFKRDIVDNPDLNFRKVKIYPIKDDKCSMQTLFNHLTTEKIEEQDEQGEVNKRRVFDIHRSDRLHWLRYHLEENKKDGMEVFSLYERIEGKTVSRTYIYDVKQKYVIVLEPQRNRGYYLLTAFYLHKSFGVDQMQQKLKNRLSEVL